MKAISGELTSIRLGLGRRSFAVSTDETQHLFKSLELSHLHPKIHADYFQHSSGTSWRNRSFASQQQCVVLSWNTIIEHFVCRVPIMC